MAVLCHQRPLVVAKLRFHQQPGPGGQEGRKWLLVLTPVNNSYRGPITDLRRKLLDAYAKPIRVGIMDLSEFTENYSQLGDDQLLCLWADRNALVPEAAMALDSEIQRRGLKKENAERTKKRFDTLAARVEKGPLGKQVATAKYERNMRHFVGWQEPEFISSYGGRDIRNTFAISVTSTECGNRSATTRVTGPSFRSGSISCLGWPCSASL